MFTNKFFKVAYGITIAEGWKYKGASAAYPLGTPSYINHNPGNLRASPYQANVSAGFAVFENDMVGFYGIVHQLYLYATGRNSLVSSSDTIEKAIGTYNGLSQGTVELSNYLDILEKVGGVLRTQPISILLT